MTKLQKDLADLLGLGNDIEGEVTGWEPDINYTQCRMVEDWVIKNGLKEEYLMVLTQNCITSDQICVAIMAYPDYSDEELTGRLAGEAIMRSTAKERCEAAVAAYKLAKLRQIFPLPKQPLADAKG